jgi:hypothetical protein
MFEGPDYPKSLKEDQFDLWLEEGRAKKINYELMLVIWDAFEEKYAPVYVENKSECASYQPYGDSTKTETVIAIYDLYSEARINFF